MARIEPVKSVSFSLAPLFRVAIFGTMPMLRSALRFGRKSKAWK
jgi:hypothetical protein